MKSVGNLTAFVREHMLEAVDVQPRIDALIGHFDDLNRAHEAVLKAKRQIERLTPLAADCDRHRSILQQSVHLRTCRDGLRVYFAALKADLLNRRLANLRDEQRLLSQQIAQLAQMRREQLGSRDQLKQAIAENGGDRIERLKAEIQEKTDRKTRRKERAGRYQQLAQQADLPEMLTIDTFVENRNRIDVLLGDLARQEADFQNAHTEGAVQLQGLKQQHEELCAEIESLRQRRSNIDSKQIRIRRMLCEALRVDETDMPFAGELIQVKAEEAAGKAPPSACCTISDSPCWSPIACTRRWPNGWTAPTCTGALCTSVCVTNAPPERSTCTPTPWQANWPSNRTRRFTTGWSTSWAGDSTLPAARPWKSSAGSSRPSPAPDRSSRAAGAMKRTIATPWTTAAVSSWAGATSTRSPPWPAGPNNSNRPCRPLPANLPTCSSGCSSWPGARPPWCGWANCATSTKWTGRRWPAPSPTWRRKSRPWKPPPTCLTPCAASLRTWRPPWPKAKPPWIRAKRARPK